MSNSGTEYLHHILDEARYLIDRARGLSREDFMGDETLKRAVVRSLEVIGEATKQVPDETKARYHHVQWRAIAGMRDRLIHGYASVDYEIVWDVLINEVRTLKRDVIEIIRREGGGK